MTGQLIVIGGGGILGADGHFALGAIIARTDKTDVDGHILRNLSRNIGAAQTDFFAVGECKQGAVFGLEALCLQILQRGKTTGNGCLVIDEAGLQIAVGCNLAAGIYRDHVAVANTQSIYISLGVNRLVQNHHHGILVALHRAGIIEHMDRVGLTGHQAGIGTSVAGVDGDRFAFQTCIVDAAQLTHTDHAVAVDAAHYHAQRIQMSAHQHSLAVVFTLQRKICSMLVVKGDRFAQFGSQLLNHRVHLHIIAYRAGNADDFLKIRQDILRIKGVFHGNLRKNTVFSEKV